MEKTPPGIPIASRLIAVLRHSPFFDREIGFVVTKALRWTQGERAEGVEYKCESDENRVKRELPGAILFATGCAVTEKLVATQREGGAWDEYTSSTRALNSELGGLFKFATGKLAGHANEAP